MASGWHVAAFVAGIIPAGGRLQCRSMRRIHSKVPFTDITSIYEKEVVRRSLKSDERQIETARILTNLCRELSVYVPPAIISNDSHSSPPSYPAGILRMKNKACFVGLGSGIA